MAKPTITRATESEHKFLDWHGIDKDDVIRRVKSEVGG